MKWQFSLHFQSWWQHRLPHWGSGMSLSFTPHHPVIPSGGQLVQQSYWPATHFSVVVLLRYRRPSSFLVDIGVICHLWSDTGAICHLWSNTEFILSSLVRYRSHLSSLIRYWSYLSSLWSDTEVICHLWSDTGAICHLWSNTEFILSSLVRYIS
jgi:hypothetical protein